MIAGLCLTISPAIQSIARCHSMCLSGHKRTCGTRQCYLPTVSARIWSTSSTLCRVVMASLSEHTVDLIAIKLFFKCEQPRHLFSLLIATRHSDNACWMFSGWPIERSSNVLSIFENKKKNKIKFTHHFTNENVSSYRCIPRSLTGIDYKLTPNFCSLLITSHGSGWIDSTEITETPSDTIWRWNCFFPLIKAAVLSACITT